MRGKAYAIMSGKDVVAISLSRLNAQEICMDYALETSLEVYNGMVGGYGHEIAIAYALDELDSWQIWEFNLV